jgi:predicted phage terminase large subunit-like protein
MEQHNKYLEIIRKKPEIKNFLNIKLTKYIPHIPTAKQSAFLWLDTLDAFYGGQGHPLDTQILTPFGFQNLGSLKINDLVITPDNQKSKILDIIKLGKRKLYEFTFSDNTKIKSTDDHIWKYRTNLRWKLGHTIDLMLEKCAGHKIEIPTIEPIDLENNNNINIIANAKNRKLYLKKLINNYSYFNSCTALLGDRIIIKDKTFKERQEIKNIIQSLGGIAEEYQNVLYISEKHKKQKKYLKEIKQCEITEAWCINIDHPAGLYIANDFIVTHNCGGGKSDALLMAALQYVDIPGYSAVLIRDTYANLSKTEGLLDRADSWLMGTDARWIGDQKAWIFPSGAKLSFGYLDSPKDHFNYQGPEYQFIGVDECVGIRENQANFMFSRLRKKEPNSYKEDLKRLAKYKKLKDNEIEYYYNLYKNIPLRFRCASNPPLREQADRGKWVKEKYVDKKTRDKSTIFIPSGLNDNPHVNKKEYLKSLDKLDPITKAKLRDGDWEISEKGTMFDRAWFKIVEAAPINCRWIRFWDLAATESTEKNLEPCYTAGVLMGKDTHGIVYIQDIQRFRKTPLGNEQHIKQTAQLDRKQIEIFMEFEGGASGVSIIDHYQRKILFGYTFKGIYPKGSKIERAAPFSSYAQAGNVCLVKGEWNKAFLNEVELFPDSAFKDQVDAASGAFKELASKPEFKIRSI